MGMRDFPTLFPDSYRSAIIDAGGRYRYLLTRRWGPARGSVCWVLLNPSTADAEVDDPTIRRCIGFSRRLGFDAMQIANLFALRSTNPAALKGCDDPIGPKNDAHIRLAVTVSSLTIVAWGRGGRLRGRDRDVTRLLAPLVSLNSFGTTADGSPRHPLYLQSEEPLLLWEGRWE